MAKAKTKKSAAPNKATEANSPVGLVLVVLVVAAVGALAYLSGKMAGETTDAAPKAQATAQDEAAPQIEIVPGDPVVGKFNGEDILRSDVIGFMQNMPANLRQLPIEQLYPIALEQVINARTISKAVKGVRLDRDPQVKEQLAAAKEQIVRNVYINNEVAKRVTPERMQQAYDAYKENFAKVQEVRASHILVDKRSAARDLIKQLNDGADFAQLAKENSQDSTAANGGDLGYFLKTDVVEEFGDAAFNLEVGTYTKQPVKSEFGYHVIKSADNRERPVPTLEEAAPFLEPQLRRLFLDQVVQEWRAEQEIERFDINGQPLAAPTPAAQAADMPVAQ